MGFCGTSLYVSSIIAAVYGILFSTYGISWTSFIIYIQQEWLTKASTDFDVHWFSIMKGIFIYSGKVIYGLVMLTLILNLFWLLSSILLIIGNKKKATSLLYVWITICSMILIADTGSLLYCVVNLINVCWSRTNETCIAFAITGALFNKFGLISIAIQIALIIYVSSRAREIKQQLRPLSQISMYSPSGYLPTGYILPMQPYPDGGQVLQPPNFQFLSPRSPQIWTEPAPPYTEESLDKVNTLPPHSRSNLNEAERNVETEPAIQRIHSQKAILSYDQNVLQDPRQYEPEIDYD